jgi:hypothetical protein
MAVETIAHPAPQTTTRIDRGRALYLEHSDEIYCVRYHEGWFWLVPSASDAESCYEVRLGRRESCECADYSHHGHLEPCKHVVAATIARAKTRQCAGCSKRFPRRETVEVHEEHASLTFFVGGVVCASCALAGGVL